jgi:hypothetical protein
VSSAIFGEYNTHSHIHTAQWDPTVLSYYDLLGLDPADTAEFDIKVTHTHTHTHTHIYRYCYICVCVI